MTKLMQWFATLAISLSLVACGGGGDGGSNPNPGGGGTGGGSTITCPNGAQAASAANCAVIGIGSSSIADGATGVNPTSLMNGVVVTLNGAVNPATMNMWLYQGLFRVRPTGSAVNSMVIAGVNNMQFTLTPVVRPAFGNQYSLFVAGTDSVGRPFNFVINFTTMAMLCNDSSIWVSAPASFSVAIGDCLAEEGQQVKLSSMNKQQDNSCVFTAGTAISQPCLAYFFNGTMLAVKTGTVVNGNHPAVWAGYTGFDGASYIALFDSTNMQLVAVTKTQYPLLWMIGNPSGVNTNLSANGVACDFQFAPSGSTIVATWIPTPLCPTKPQ